MTDFPVGKVISEVVTGKGGNIKQAVSDQLRTPLNGFVNGLRHGVDESLRNLRSGVPNAGDKNAPLTREEVQLHLPEGMKRTGVEPGKPTARPSSAAAPAAAASGPSIVDSVSNTVGGWFSRGKEAVKDGAAAAAGKAAEFRDNAVDAGKKGIAAAGIVAGAVISTPVAEAAEVPTVAKPVVSGVAVGNPLPSQTDGAPLVAGLSTQALPNKPDLSKVVVKEPDPVSAKPASATPALDGIKSDIQNAGGGRWSNSDPGIHARAQAYLQEQFNKAGSGAVPSVTSAPVAPTVAAAPTGPAAP